MNTFAANPHWGWWIILYFYLGGIAAGAFFLSTLLELIGSSEDRLVARLGYQLAFPLILVCGIFLIVDLNQPARFWHMLLRSEVVAAAFAQGWPWSLASWRTMAAAPLLKYWSPMSIGSWALTLFGACSSLLYVAALWPQGFVARWVAWPWLGYPLRLVGCGVGFFVAAYTGVLLTATNQPLWSDTLWLGALFLASAASTGAAALLVLFLGQRRPSPATLHRLQRADVWMLSLELAVLVLFLASLGSWLRVWFAVLPGQVLLGVTLVGGVLIPLGLHLGTRRHGPAMTRSAAILVLIGGFALRWAIVTTPPQLSGVTMPAATAGAGTRGEFGPEAGRPRGGGRGADPGNRPMQLQPRSKVFFTHDE